MWPFSKKEKLKTDNIAEEPKEEKKNEETKTEDPLLKAKLGASDVFQRLLKAMQDEKGVHIESFLCVLGSLTGYSCQASLRKLLIEQKNLSEDKVFTIIECKDGSRYFYGDILNAPIIEGTHSIWSMAAGIVKYLGAEKLLDINEIFSHVSETIGSEEFGRIRLPEGHNTGDTPYNYVKNLWPVILPVIESYCPPDQWPILFGLAIQEAIVFGRTAIEPAFALSIIMESVIYMSKIDLK